MIWFSGLLSFALGRSLCFGGLAFYQCQWVGPLVGGSWIFPVSPTWKWRWCAKVFWLHEPHSESPILGPAGLLNRGSMAADYGDDP